MNDAARDGAAKSQPLTWLTSIVRNRSLDRLRRRELDVVEPSGDDDAPAIDYPVDEPSPVDLLLAGADARSLRDCVDVLEPGPLLAARASASAH